MHIRQALAAISIGIVCAACGASDRGAGPVKIAWITIGPGTPVYDLGRSGAVLAAADLSAASGKQVEALVMDPASQSADAQIAAFQAAVDANVQAIAISPYDPAKIAPNIDSASDAGIRVLTFDNDAPDSKRLTYYNMDNYKASQTAFQILAKLMNDSGEFALWDSSVTIGVYGPREQAFQDELAKHPNMHLVATFSCGSQEQGTTANCTTPLDPTLAEHPKITGWYFMRGKAIWEADLANEAPNLTAALQSGQIKSVAFDTSGSALTNMASGYVQALIAQKYFGWGYDLVSLAFDAVEYKRQFTPITDSGFDVVCPNNLTQLNSLLQAKDFRSPLEPCSELP